MKANYRVIISGNSGDGFIYRIEDIYFRQASDISPFVQHIPSIVSASSIEELKNILREMLEACDKKLLVLQPEQLVEKSDPMGGKD